MRVSVFRSIPKEAVEALNLAPLKIYRPQGPGVRRAGGNRSARQSVAMERMLICVEGRRQVPMLCFKVRGLSAAPKPGLLLLRGSQAHEMTRSGSLSGIGSADRGLALGQGLTAAAPPTPPLPGSYGGPHRSAPGDWGRRMLNSFPRPHGLPAQP